MNFKAKVMQRMNCEEAKKIDIVHYLSSLGYQPQKIRGSDYWYLSPLRAEKHPSFKVNRPKNVWFDHGIGKGGKLIDFLMEYFQCDVAEALRKLSPFHQQDPVKQISKPAPLHLHNSNLDSMVAGETAIKIIAAKQPINSSRLCSYLKLRRIEKNIADKYCHEVIFSMNDKEYLAIGFKNNDGGFELRNEYFKGGSSPKSVSYFGQNSAEKITVFEGFFDFLTYQSIHQNQQQELTNYLVLNSLSFFDKSLPIMEKYNSIHLYLDNDIGGKKFLDKALKLSGKFIDESKLYQGYKDLNEWSMNLGKLQKLKQLKPRTGKHL